MAEQLELLFEARRQPFQDGPPRIRQRARKPAKLAELAGFGRLPRKNLPITTL